MPDRRIRSGDIEVQVVANVLDRARTPYRERVGNTVPEVWRERVAGPGVRGAEAGGEKEGEE